MNTKIIVMAVVGVLVIGGGVFYASTKFKGDDNRPDLNRINQEGPRDGQGAVGDRTIGEIIAKDDTSITVKLPDGSSRVVLISSSTSINKMAGGSVTTGSIADLAVGENVMVIGTSNADVSVNAESIQLIGSFQRPAGGQFPGAPGR